MPSSSEGQEFLPRSRAESIPGKGQDAENPEPVDLKQVYTLVDSVLPFEACLYYQVLPLFIKGSRLVVGMVNLEDRAAVEYVKKQLSYINYSIAFKAVPSEWHRDLLSKYLSHNAQASQQPQLGARQKTAPTSPPPTWEHSSAPAEDPNVQKTYIVDQPDEIFVGSQGSGSAYAKTTAPQNSQEMPTFVTETLRTSSPPKTETDSPNSSVNQTLNPLELQIDHQYRHAGESELVSLSPQVLVQALLAKILGEGIGRLYFERRSNTGRVLWSKDGILQAVIESIDAQVFQGVINEFKRLTHLSLITIKKPRQVEIERIYEGQRILLRFRVMPGTHGEEATLQVLRGTALKFYQQQQMDKLEQDALDAAQQLQDRLHEIRERARQSLHGQSPRSATLPTLVQLLRQIESEIQEIVSIYGLNTPSDRS